VIYDLIPRLHVRGDFHGKWSPVGITYAKIFKLLFQESGALININNVILPHRRVNWDVGLG
jgi:hypothetical protein